MNKLVPLGLGTAAVVGALVIGAQLLGPAPDSVGGTPSEAPSPTATASPTAASADGLPFGPFLAVEAADGLPSITATIPAPGWTFDTGFDALGKGDEVENVPEAGLLLWSYPAGTGFDVYGDPCQWASTAPDVPATTVDAFAAALAAQPSRDATAPVDVTVGGFAGKSLTLHVPDDIAYSGGEFSECDEANFTSYGVAAARGSEPSRWHQGPGQIDELWILNVDGTTVVLDAMYRHDTPAELIDELRAIAESTTFE